MNDYNVIFKEPNVIWISGSKIEDRIDVNPFKSEHIENDKILENIDNITIGEALRSKRDITGGATPLGANYLNEGIRFIRTQNVQRNYIDLSDVVYISNEDNDKLSRSKLEEDDVLLTITGADFGRIAPVTRNHLPANINQHSVRIHFKENIDPYFISTYLNCKYGQSQIYKYSVGATRPAIDYVAIKKIKIPVPYLKIQKYIGDQLRRAEELRVEAKRLKGEAEQLIGNYVGLDRLADKAKDFIVTNKWIDSINISGRIDGQYYTNPVTEINKYMKNINMELVVLKEIAKVGKGFSFSNEESSNGVPYIRISDLEDLLIDYSEVVKVDYKTYQQKKKSQLKHYDLIMAITGATIGKVSAFYSKEIDKATLSADTAYVRFHNPDDSMAYLLYFKTVIGQFAITQGITGATNKHLAIEDIRNIVLPKFEDAIKEEVKNKIIQSVDNTYTSKILIQQAKQDVEDLIEGNFDMSKLNDTAPEGR